jgi:hypothetical protein
MPVLGDPLFTLSHYRWRGAGNGIIKLATAVAAREWNYDGVEWQCPLYLPFVAGTDNTSARRQAILAVCDPMARVCVPGYFDLSISVSLSQTSNPGLPYESPNLRRPLALTLSGPDNQSFRRCECLSRAAK